MHSQMKSSQDKPKDPKLKAQFNKPGHAAVPHNSIHAGHPVSHFVRQRTPGPYAPLPGFSTRANEQVVTKNGNNKHETSTSSGGNHKIAGQDNHAMPFQKPPPKKIHHKNSTSDIWVRIKTVESDALEGPEPSGSVVSKFQNKSQGEYFGKKKVVRRLLDYDGRDLSLTDLLPPTLGKRTLRILERYGTTGHAVPESMSTAGTVTHFTIVHPAVQNGMMFIPTKFRPRPELNSFAESRELGQARKKWTVDLGSYRDSDVLFTLEEFTHLVIEAKQSTQYGQVRMTTETIDLPMGFDIDHIRVYRNHQAGMLSLIVAYMPTQKS